MMPRNGEVAGIDPLVIVVDDDQAVRNSLEFSLAIEGFAVRSYAEGRDLLEDSREVPGAGCLVVDQNMPGMTGLDLISTLRERAVAAPAILITSHPTAAVRQRAAQAGVRIVEKPLLGNALIDVIRDLCALAGATTTAHSSAGSPA
jgi:FixJ family two-component response regulator